MATSSIFLTLTTFLLSLTSFIQARNIPIQQEGFTLDLIHRDSTLSPLYNPTSTRSELITNAYHRSVNRAKKTSSPADITYNQPAYIMKYSIGTPPFETLGFVHTGTDLSWTECTPCKFETDCHNLTNPIFNPNKSSSYKPLSCNSDSCSALGSSVSALGGTNTSCNNQKECLYSMIYDEMFYTDGDLASETITFGSTSGKLLSFNNFAFGCSHDSLDGYTNDSVLGNIGLGNGPLSIVKQLNGVVQGKFSYCLAPYDGSDDIVTSQISFGAHAVVEGPGVVSTPLVKNASDTNYRVTLESLHVRNKTLFYKKNSNNQEGNIIINLGSGITVLPRDLYDDLEAELKNAIGLPTGSDPDEFFSLCYCVRNRDELNIPNITVSFTGGADLELPPRSTFLINDHGNYCLAMIPLDLLSSRADDTAVFGSLLQENFMVGYDLVNNKVSFKPTDCSSRSS